jgi:hypothetical protein
MRRLLVVLVGLVMLAAAGIASADPVIDVWTCTLKDGKTAEESQAAGKMWVEVVRRITGNDEITSTWASAIVGDAGTFMWLDTYPSLEVYAAAQTAIANSKEFEPAGAALDETQTCSGNQLLNSTVVD